MHHDPYTEGRTGALVPIDGGHFAFVPNPLPPDIRPSWDLSNCISRADRALLKLAGAAQNLPNPHLFVRPFITREAVLSSQIEGTQCSISDLVRYESVDQADDDSDVHEVYNYVRAMETGLARLSDLPMCLRIIREVHEILMTDVRGRNRSPGAFRRIQNYIAPSGVPLERARYIPPPPAEMELLMNQLETYINTPDEYPPLVKLALTHYQFEAVHPFEDGNGRVGRLLITLMLIAERLLPSPLLYLSVYFEKNRKTYYDLLLNVSQTGAWEDWLRFFLLGVEEQSLDAVARTEVILRLWNDYRSRLQGVRASSLGPQLVDELFNRPIVTVKRAMKLLGNVTHRTAQLTIDRLVDAGILSLPGSARRNRLYVATEIMDVIEADRPLKSTEPVSRTLM